MPSECLNLWLHLLLQLQQKKKKKRLAFLPVIDLKFTKLLLKMERQTVGKLIATALSKHLVIV